MSIHDDIVNQDAAIQAEIDAVLVSIKDDLSRLTVLQQSLEASRAAREAQVTRMTPVVSALQALGLP